MLGVDLLSRLAVLWSVVLSSLFVSSALGTNFATEQPTSLAALGAPNRSATVQRDRSGREFVQVDDMLLSVGPQATAIYGGRRWTVGAMGLSDVPVAFDTSVSAQQQKLFFAACYVWSAVAKLRCVPRANQGDYLYVLSSDRNASYVGRQGGRQDLDIVNWYQYVIAHEIGHALGLKHEQQRPDRDRFVKINFRHIQPGMEHNFVTESGETFSTTYDFASIMHYSPTAFSIGGTLLTIEPLPAYASQLSIMGSGIYRGPTQQDLQGMARRYNGVVETCRGLRLPELPIDRGGCIATCTDRGWEICGCDTGRGARACP